MAGLRHSVPLFGQYMQQDGPFLTLHIAQPATQRRQVVPVNGSDVTEAKFFEQHPARENSLEAVAKLFDGLVGHAADNRHLGQEIVQVPHGTLVEIGQPRLIQAAGKAADACANGHLVVIEDYEQLLAQPARVI